MVFASNSFLEKFPSVLLHKHEGLGHIYPGERLRQFSSPTKFRLIPLNADGEILEPKEDTWTRKQYLSELLSWKYVAIRCETREAFLSCKRRTHIPGLGDSALVEYREKIGISERFEFHRFAETESFSFKTHNGLYLSNNKALGGIVFRSESRLDGSTIASHRTWEITPILNFSSADQHIKYVGVIDNSKRVVMKLQPMEEKEEDDGKDHELSLRDHNILRHAAVSVLGDILAQGLRRGECTSFCTHDGDCHYYVRDKRGFVYIVVVSKGFSRALAGECVNDLVVLYKHFSKTPQNQRIQNELRFLVWNYNEHNENFRHHPLRKKICKKMEDAIDQVLDYKGNKIGLGDRVQELNRIAEDFRKTMRQLRGKQISKWVVAGAVWGGFVGGIWGGTVGMAAGGPAGASFLGMQAAKVGAYVVGASTSKGIRRSIKPLMWKKYSPSVNYGI
mmetsp:Transcript_6470/g.13379  ORF Transcript_6470/g.13379 Transcript_6470/m.13379 type:complete len:448 (-) Transcript_6470:108-1451(-)|eukprot:CAMPEP_0197264278 /NCGR_PEP_ID=MMETSP1432-20130617/1700_1 /TAXON_ID=44447 /ORGANISM="Pseudo-nitzschia delicatissima, Strain UNC1205" /LENGTH=447 /DNA_ID=CAMNT_0042728909 /DNA_START=31 /DNA_END=1374 /DNA_ORIENTATION=+